MNVIAWVVILGVFAGAAVVLGKTFGKKSAPVNANPNPPLPVETGGKKPAEDPFPGEGTGPRADQ